MTITTQEPREPGKAWPPRIHTIENGTKINEGVFISWEEHEAILAAALEEQRKKDDAFYFKAIEQSVNEAVAKAYEQAADSFRECGETAVSLAYMDKARDARKEPHDR